MVARNSRSLSISISRSVICSLSPDRTTTARMLLLPVLAPAQSTALHNSQDNTVPQWLSQLQFCAGDCALGLSLHQSLSSCRLDGTQCALSAVSLFEKPLCR